MTDSFAMQGSKAFDKPVTGRKVLILLLGFFGVMLTANAIFVYFALTSFSGLETENAYLKGLDYNATLEDAAEQRALGWQANLAHEVLSTEGSRVTLTYLDKAGRPLDGLAVALEIRRPTTETFDQTLELLAVGPGRYQADFSFPEKGAWFLRISASQDGEPRHRLEQRLWLD